MRFSRGLGERDWNKKAGKRTEKIGKRLWMCREERLLGRDLWKKKIKENILIYGFI